MRVGRLPGFSFALLLCLSAVSISANPANQSSQAAQTPRPQPDPDTVALVHLVDAAIIAAPAVEAGDRTQGDIPIKWESAHFIKGQNGAYVPFTVSFDPALVRSTDVAVYIRAIHKNQLSAAAATLSPTPSPAGPARPPAPKYAWDNVHFMPRPTDGRITRAIALPPGDYELFVAVKERTSAAPTVTSTPPTAMPPRSGLLRHAVTAPDFNKPELQTSSVMLARAVQPISSQLSPADQEANPYVFGPMRIVPSPDGRFAKSNELQLLFWVYGATGLTGGKPDVSIDYSFFQKQPDGTDKYFNKTKPQELNPTTLPPEFNLAAGHQLPGSLIVDLMSFPSGDYRLEIKVTDKPSGKVVTQNVPFTVTG
jgi:hypothetical protein